MLFAFHRYLGIPGRSLAMYAAIAFAVGAAPLYGAAAATELVVFSGSYSGGTGCVTPPPAATFGTSDQVHVYFLVRSVAANDHLELHWVNTDTNVWRWTHQWNESNPGNWCYTGMYANASDLGAGRWKVEGWVNGSKQIETGPFTVGTATGPSNTTPDFEGYLDAATCDKVYGWAHDKRSQTSISVDIYDGNVKIDSIRADQARDLLGGSWAFNWIPPQSVKDGQTHMIGAKFGGQTQQSLIGSPKPLVCTGQRLQPSNTKRWQYNSQNGYATTIFEKQDQGGQKYTYRITVIGRETVLSAGLWRVNITMLYPNGVRSDRNHIEIADTSSSRSSVLTGTASWSVKTPVTVSSKGEAGSKLVTDLLGLIDPIGWLQIGGDIVDLISAGDRAPSSWFSAKLEAQDDYHVVPISYEAYRDFWGNTGIMAARFTIPNVDESTGNQPEFYVLMQTPGFDVFSFEIGLDRNALVWTRN